jgi:hypothetical protein
MLPTLCLIIALLMAALALALRRFHVAHNYRTAPLSIFIGTGLILGFFTCWAGLTPGPVAPLVAAQALGWLDIAAGAGAVPAWAYLAWQDRQALAQAQKDEARRG